MSCVIIFVFPSIGEYVSPRYENETDASSGKVVFVGPSISGSGDEMHCNKRRTRATARERCRPSFEGEMRIVRARTKLDLTVNTAACRRVLSVGARRWLRVQWILSR